MITYSLLINLRLGRNRIRKICFHKFLSSSHEVLCVNDEQSYCCEGGVTSMEPFLNKFFAEVNRKMKEDGEISNYCKFDSQLLTSFTSSLYIAGLVFTFFASSVTRSFGRKPSILAGGVAFLVGAANVYMLLLGRILLGIGLGFTNQVLF